MPVITPLALTAFLTASSLLLLLYLVLGTGKTRLDSRLEKLSGDGDSGPSRDAVGQLTQTALPPGMFWWSRRRRRAKTATSAICSRRHSRHAASRG